MNRIQFLKKSFLGVSSFGLLSVFPNNISSVNHELPGSAIKLITTNIAGFTYYEGLENFNLLKEKDPLELRRENTNVHDFYAVELFWQGIKLGYVPRQHNRIVANMMDAGVEIIAYIRYINLDANYWNKVFFRLELK